MRRMSARDGSDNSRSTCDSQPTDRSSASARSARVKPRDRRNARISAPIAPLERSGSADPFRRDRWSLSTFINMLLFSPLKSLCQFSEKIKYFFTKEKNFPVFSLAVSSPAFLARAIARVGKRPRRMYRHRYHVTYRRQMIVFWRRPTPVPTDWSRHPQTAWQRHRRWHQYARSTQ